MFQRFRRWAKKGIFTRLFEVLSGVPDFEYALIGDTIVNVHRHGTGAKGGVTLRPSRGGLITTILARVDALGTLARFRLLPGQRHDSVGVDPVIEGVDFEALSAG